MQFSFGLLKTIDALHYPRTKDSNTIVFFISILSFDNFYSIHGLMFIVSVLATTLIF